MNNKNIVIGVDKSISSSYLVSYLYQTGSYFVYVDDIQAAIRDYGIKVFIWNSFFDMNQINEEIFIITDNFFLKDFFKVKKFKNYNSYLFNSKDIFNFKINCSFMLKRKIIALSNFPEFGHCLDKNFKLINNSGIKYFRKDFIKFVSYPFNILGEFIGKESEYRPIFSESAKKFYCEIGPTIDYSFLRKLTMHIFAFSFNRLGCPYVRYSKRLYKNGSFNIRIDADGFSYKEFKDTINLAKKHDKVFTWFIDIYSWIKHRGISFLNELKYHNQSIQIHSFRHMTYKNWFNNFLNIFIAKLIFKILGIKSFSTVSPFGFYNMNYQNAIKDLNFKYSSEFGFNFNDIASFPLNNTSYPLQIPSNNASITTLKMSGFTRKEIFDHLYKSTLKLSYENDFCILYEHPIDGIGKEYLDYDLLIEKLDKELNYDSIENHMIFIKSKYNKISKNKFLRYEDLDHKEHSFSTDFNPKLEVLLNKNPDPLEKEFFIPYAKGNIYKELVKDRIYYFKVNFKNEYESNIFLFIFVYLQKSILIIIRNLILKN